MNILDKIAASTRERVAAAKRRGYAERESGLRPFFNRDGVTLIAECKKASPSRGVMVHDYNPERLAAAYEAGGATAISVLTEPEYFLGSGEHLRAVRAAVTLPVLRKDFILDPWQIEESYAMGADAILLITAMIPDKLSEELSLQARKLGMEVLLEVHTEAELKRAAALPATAIGINARDLTTFTMDTGPARRMFPLVPADRIAVAESGLLSVQEFRDTAAAGFRAFLVGEYFATAADPQATVRGALDAVREVL